MNPPVPPPEPPMSRRQALLKLGFFQVIDAIYLVVILGLIITAGVRGGLLGGTPVEFLSWLVVALVVGQLWIITLCFRVSWFILAAQADINLLPEAAARIVLGYQQKQ